MWIKDVPITKALVMKLTVVSPFGHETDSFPVESIEFVKNCFPFNMISNSAYLLALNVFILEIG